MKKLERILRFLFVRLIFMSFCLLCVWRVLVITKQGYYWGLMICVVGLVFESGIMLWLRSAKEPEKFMPSAFFFLLCVIPSIWIITINDTHLKTKFQAEASKHENEIKTFVQSLQMTGNKDRLLGLNPSLSQASGIDQQLQYPEDLLWKNIIPKSYADITAKTPYYNHQAQKVDCCVVKVSYWFQEDVWQRIYFQLFLAITIISRWLSTKSDLKITQRMLKLLISLVITIDILFFFNLTLLELVYKSKFLLYAVLSITSVSTIQFVFVFIEEALYPLVASNAVSQQPKLSHLTYNNLHSEYHGGDVEDDSAFMYDNNMKNSDKLQKDFSAAMSNGQLSNKHSPHSELIYALSQRSKQQSPLGCQAQCTYRNLMPNPFIISLIVGIGLQDLSYLMFRILLVINIGVNGTLNLEPTLFFFMLKNLFVLFTQFYRISKHMRGLQKIRLYDHLNSIITASSASSNSQNSKIGPGSRMVMPRPEINCIMPSKQHVTDSSDFPHNKFNAMSPPPDYEHENVFMKKSAYANRNYTGKEARVSATASDMSQQPTSCFRVDKNWKMNKHMTCLSTESALLNNTSSENDKTTESDEFYKRMSIPTAKVNVGGQLKPKSFQYNQQQQQNFNATMSVDSSSTVDSEPVSPISTVKAIPFNPFSAARIGSSSIYGHNNNNNPQNKSQPNSKSSKNPVSEFIAKQRHMMADHNSNKTNNNNSMSVSTFKNRIFSSKRY